MNARSNLCLTLPPTSPIIALGLLLRAART
jgi:hypothetical protein